MCLRLTNGCGFSAKTIMYCLRSKLRMTFAENVVQQAPRLDIMSVHVRMCDDGEN